MAAVASAFQNALEPLSRSMNNSGPSLASGTMAASATTAQNLSMAQVQQAQSEFETIGALAFGVLDGDINGTPNPERWAQVMEMAEKSGMDVSTMRDRPDLAKTLAMASAQANAAIANVRSQEELDLAVKKFGLELQKGLKGDEQRAKISELLRSRGFDAEADLIDAGADFKSVYDGIAAKQKPPDQPASVDEYEYYVTQEGQAGRTPMPYGEWKKASTASTTVNVGGENKYDSVLGENLAKTAIAIKDEARSGQSTLNTLSAMEQQMKDGSFYSGAIADQVMFLKRVGAAVGIDPAGVESMESFNALSKQAALDVMGGSLGTGFSNADRDFVESQVANLQNTPTGNKAIIEITRKIAQRKVDIEKFANEYAASHGGRLDNDFEVALSEWAAANPLFAAKTTDPGQAGAGLQQTGVTNDPELDSLLEKYGQ